MALHEASLLLPVLGGAAVLLNLSDPHQLLGNRRLAGASVRREPSGASRLSACRPFYGHLVRATNQAQSNPMMLLLPQATGLPALSRERLILVQSQYAERCALYKSKGLACSGTTADEPKAHPLFAGYDTALLAAVNAACVATKAFNPRSSGLSLVDPLGSSL